MQTTRNARFWAHINGSPVKITLRPGQQLSHCTGGPTDEGWSREWHTWTHEGDHVHESMGSEGQDCDGRSGWCGEYTCGLDSLHTGNPIPDWTVDTPLRGFYPAWQKYDESRYDEYAEAAGY
jgi:hypothetical protein